MLLLALLVFLLAGEMLTPFILDVIAPGFRAEPAKFALAVGLTRIMFPYLVFISLTALQGGVLNSLERFAATSFDAGAAQPLPHRGAAGGAAADRRRRSPGRWRRRASRSSSG